jgi:hypothetical protein
VGNRRQTVGVLDAQKLCVGECAFALPILSLAVTIL